jgi:1,2-diacylglycerol 3-beta-galactosyltransferase
MVLSGGSGSSSNSSAPQQPHPQPLATTAAKAAALSSVSVPLALTAWPKPASAARPCCGGGGSNGNGSNNTGGDGGNSGNNPTPAPSVLDAIPPRDDALPRAPGSKPAAPSRRRILIMMSNTGGGHRASAEAIAAAFEELFGPTRPSSPQSPYEVLIADMWADHTPPPFNALPNSYSFLVRHAFLWRGTYHALNPRGCHYPYFSAVQALVGASLREAFDAFDPDLVVSVHPLMQHIPVRVLAARAAAAVRGANAARARAMAAAVNGGGGNASSSSPSSPLLPPRLSRDDVVVPFATVVTDFTTCHNTWFYPGVDRCFVPTEFAANLARRMGLSKRGQVVVHGLPIRPAFAREARRHRTSSWPPSLSARAKAKARLGLPRDRPAVLLIGGGEGMGALEATVRALDRSVGAAASCAVVCGRNRALLERLKSTPWPGGLAVVPVGFVDNMHEWMAGVDLLITKAGPGTLAEALISGLPILINGNIPCQEEGNIPYIVDNGAGEFERDPTKIGQIVARWLSDEGKEAFSEMARRSRALGRPEAVFEIARDLAALADEGAERRARLRDSVRRSEEALAEARAAHRRRRESCGGGRAVVASG